MPVGAGVGVGDLAVAGDAGPFEQEGGAVGGVARGQVAQVAQVLAVRAEQPVEAVEVVGMDLAAAEAEMSTPPARAQAMARGSGGWPTCQSPVPAESSWIRPASGESSMRARTMPSAIGERQMLPRQTSSRRACTGPVRSAMAGGDPGFGAGEVFGGVHARREWFGG